jgi:two-component system, cell cycle response regulator DivK
VSIAVIVEMGTIRAMRPAGDQGAPGPAPMGAGSVVLVVEDNERSLRLLADVLTFHGMEVLQARDGSEGIDLARQHAPDLVLLDVQLPDISGTDVLAILRGDPATREIPVVAVTAFAMTGDRERLLAAGFDDYLSKPLDVRTLGDRLAPLLGGASSEAFPDEG